MNWRRGLLRVWVVLSCLWVALCALFEWLTLPWPSLERCAFAIDDNDRASCHHRFSYASISAQFSGRLILTNRNYTAIVDGYYLLGFPKNRAELQEILYEAIRQTYLLFDDRLTDEDKYRHFIGTIAAPISVPIAVACLFIITLWIKGGFQSGTLATGAPVAPGSSSATGASVNTSTHGMPSNTTALNEAPGVSSVKRAPGGVGDSVKVSTPFTGWLMALGIVAVYVAFAVFFTLPITRRLQGVSPTLLHYYSEQMAFCATCCLGVLARSANSAALQGAAYFVVAASVYAASGFGWFDDVYFLHHPKWEVVIDGTFFALMAASIGVIAHMLRRLILWAFRNWGMSGT